MGSEFDEATVEGIRQEVLKRGFKRLMLLGPEDIMAGPVLRRPIAASGVMVLAPGAVDRPWVAACREEDRQRLRELVLHGMEHGADSVLVVGECLATCVRHMDLGIPLLEVGV